MNIENMLESIKECNMKRLLSALQSGKVILSHETMKDIPQEIINKACHLRLAYRLNDDVLVTKEYIYNHILTELKKNDLSYVEYEAKGIPLGKDILSPSLVKDILETLVSKELAFKEGTTYRANHEKIISKEQIESFLKPMARVFSVEEIVRQFGFGVFVTQYGHQVYSDVAMYCKQILEQLVSEEKAIKRVTGIDQYYWNII
jgi:hypothetical protein